MSIESLHRFSAGSANDDTHKHLWIQGASLFIEQLNSFLKYTNYKPNILDISIFENENQNTLGQILNYHGSDKASHHNYYILYSYIFQKLGRENPLKILEIGLGTNNPNLVSTMGPSGRPGASLYAWRDYLPHSQIYGADIDRDILFENDRIQTHYIDQLDITTFSTMQSTLKTKYDLIIDDGLHSIGANLNTLLFALENIKEDGWIVIEDISNQYIDNWYSIDYFLKQNTDYKVSIVKAKLSHIFLVHKIKKGF